MATHELPADTPSRVVEAIMPRRDDGFELRYVLGPWRWMLLVYRLDEDGDLAEVVAIEDARSSRAVTQR